MNTGGETTPPPKNPTKAEDWFQANQNTESAHGPDDLSKR